MREPHKLHRKASIMCITVHRMYYGPVEENGILLKTTPQLRNGKVINTDVQTDIYTKQGRRNETVEDSELLYTADGPIIRVTKITPLKAEDNRTVQSCNLTLLVKLSDLSNAIKPLLEEPLTFPLKEVKFKLVRDGGT